MIDLSLDGLDALTQRLDRLPRALGDRVAAAVERLGGVLRERVQRKLSGEVLQQKSGRLAASIAVDVERSGSAVSVTVGSDAPYAAIHEYGGTIPAHAILPQSARVLAFPWRGRQRFFKRVSLPAVTLPERSFLRSALAETEPEIGAAVAAAALEAIQG